MMKKCNNFVNLATFVTKYNNYYLMKQWKVLFKDPLNQLGLNKLKAF